MHSKLNLRALTHNPLCERQGPCKTPSKTVTCQSKEKHLTLNAASQKEKAEVICERGVQDKFRLPEETSMSKICARVPFDVYQNPIGSIYSHFSLSALDWRPVCKLDNILTKASAFKKKPREPNIANVHLPYNHKTRRRRQHLQSYFKAHRRFFQFAKLMFP